MVGIDRSIRSCPCLDGSDHRSIDANLPPIQQKAAHSHITSRTPNHTKPQNGVAILILLYVILRCHRLADNALRLRMEGLAFALLTVDLGYLLALTGVKGAAAKATMEEVIG